MSYRPDDWIKQRSKFFEENQQENRWGKTRQLDYETGADAMLEELKRKGQHVDRKTTITNNQNPETFYQFESGWLVFIPDESEK